MDKFFVERLNLVLSDRKQTPWGKSLGFTGGSISSIFGGRIPGPEILNVIRRAENVNLNWLLTGEGKPFIVNYFPNAKDFVETLDAMLNDECWKVCVCALAEQTVLILTMPGQYEFKGKWVDYTMCEILVGHGSEELANVLRNHQGQRDIYITPDLPSETLKQIANGELGSYGLLAEGFGYWIQPANSHDLEFIQEARQGAPVSAPLMRAVVKLVEDCAQKSKQVLTNEQKSRVITAAYRQAERLNLTEDEILSAIETAFDVLKD
ncbi:transcriptional regulator [Vibrio cholerae]